MLYEVTGHQIGAPGRSQQSSSFYMEMSAIKVLVKCDLWNDVRMQVRRARVIGSIELCAKLSVKGKGENSLAYAHKLLWVFHCDAQSPVVIGMIDKPDLWSAGPGKANLVIEVHVLAEEDVRWNG